MVITKAPQGNTYENEVTDADTFQEKMMLYSHKKTQKKNKHGPAAVNNHHTHISRHVWPGARSCPVIILVKEKMKNEYDLALV